MCIYIPLSRSISSRFRVDPGTETLTITNSPRKDGLVKVQTGPDTADGTYTGWYNKVYEPVAVTSEAAQTAEIKK